MLGFLVELLFICLKCPLARMPSLPHILTKPITFVCFFSVIFILVSFLYLFCFIYLLIYLFIYLVLAFVCCFFCLFSILFLLIEYCKGGVPIRQFIHASGLLTSIY
jgi:hypothetical protein